MGKSKALSTSNQYVKYTIEIVQNSQSIQDNSSNVTVKVRFYRTNTGYTTYGTGKIYCKINGTQYSANVTSSQKITNSGIELFTKTLTIDHDADGTKDLVCSAWIDISVLTSSEQSYTQELTTIPRYATITTFTTKPINETSIQVTWGCDASCDKIYYSLNFGSWIEANGYPNFTITGLSSGTAYNIKIRVRRTDSQLTTDSELKAEMTYAYPHCIETPDFTIGDPVTLKFYNPLKRSCKFYVIANGVQLPIEYEFSGTSYTGIYAPNSSVAELYKTIPNAQSGKYKIKVVYEKSERIYDNGNTYKIKGTEIPTVNGVSYEDIASNVVAITGNNQHIVQNQSILQINYEKATPNYSAGSIKKYSFEYKGAVIKESTTQGGSARLGKVNSANDIDITLTVTDSRGLTAQKTLKITMLSHSEPTASVTLERLNNYEDETYLTVDASISSVNGKNTVAVEYRYKLSTDEYSPFVQIPNREKQTLSLDKHSIFVFNVVVTDAFGAKFDREYVLYKGVFPLFIDTEKNAVGINEFPAENEALRVAGGVGHFDVGLKISGEMVADTIVEQGTSGIWTYRKWKSGNVDMECVVSNTSNVMNELVEVTIALPFAVSKIKPYLTCLASGWALTKPPYFNIYGGNSVTDNCEELKLYYTADNTTSRAYYFGIQVKGTWR